MLFLSFILNTVLLFVILNWSYWQNKKNNPDYPDKPYSQMILFPLTLGIVLTIIFDAFKGIFIYQTIIFLVLALLLYWVFFIAAKK